MYFNNFLVVLQLKSGDDLVSPTVNERNAYGGIFINNKF